MVQNTWKHNKDKNSAQRFHYLTCEIHILNYFLNIYIFIA